MSADKKDRELGMHCPITRRDFLNGVAIGVGGTLAGRALGGETLLDEAALDDYAPEKAARGGTSDEGTNETRRQR